MGRRGTGRRSLRSFIILHPCVEHHTNITRSPMARGRSVSDVCEVLGSASRLVASNIVYAAKVRHVHHHPCIDHLPTV